MQIVQYGSWHQEERTVLHPSVTAWKLDHHLPLWWVHLIDRLAFASVHLFRCITVSEAIGRAPGGMGEVLRQQGVPLLKRLGGRPGPPLGTEGISVWLATR